MNIQDTMDAPDRIFIDSDLIAFHVLDTPHEGDTEYISRDWLLKVLTDLHDKAESTWNCSNDDYDCGQFDAYEKLIQMITTKTN